MAIPKKARTIDVNGERYRWMTSRSSNILSVPVYIQRADGHGCLLETVYHVETAWRIATDGQHSLFQKTAVTPRNIRKLIQQSLQLGWRPGSSGQFRVRCGWRNELSVLPPVCGNRCQPFEPTDNWDQGDPLAALTSCLTAHGRPHPAWLRRWDGISNAWQATCDPAVMLDVLLFTNMADQLVSILRTFAFREGVVGELLQLETMGFPMGTGWQRHCDGTNAHLNPEEKRRSIVEDIKLLSNRARKHASIHDFRIDMIESTDIGTHGDWTTFCAVTADIIRSIVPEPPTLERITTGYRG